MPLMKSSDPGASNREPSHFAKTTVRKMLEQNRSSIEGLDELLRDHYTINSSRGILDAVRNGDRVLVTNSSNAAESGGLVCFMPAVSINVMPSSMPWRRAATSRL